MFDQEKSCEFDCYQLIHKLLSEIINIIFFQVGTVTNPATDWFLAQSGFSYL